LLDELYCYITLYNIFVYLLGLETSSTVNVVNTSMALPLIQTVQP